MAVAGSLVIAAPASASAGDWGFPSAGEMQAAGGTYSAGATFPELNCIAGPCDFDPTMSFTATAENGTTFANVGASSDMEVDEIPGSPIGTCTVETTTSYVCRPTTSGTVVAGGFVNGTGLTWTIPATAAAGSTAVDFSWSDVLQTGNDSSNDHFLVTVTVPTTLSATPAIIKIIPPKVYLFNLNGTLTTAAGPLSGETVTFKAGSTVICSAVTNVNGTASCNGIGSLLSIVLSFGYTANFAGSGSFLPSSAHAALIS